MEKKELYTGLSEEQMKLYDFLEEKGYIVHLFEQDGEICAEVENWTEGGVNMIITLLPFSFDALKEWFEGFDVDEEIEIHRQGEDYRKAFRISQSVKDFEEWEKELEETIESFKE